MVSGGDKVAGALAGHLQVFDFAKIATETAGRFHDGVDHDGHQGRTDHKKASHEKSTEIGRTQRDAVHVSLYTEYDRTMPVKVLSPL